MQQKKKKKPRTVQTPHYHPALRPPIEEVILNANLTALSPMSPHAPCRLRTAPAAKWSESATSQLLILLGFSCPFLLPSFFIHRQVGQLKHDYATTTVQDRKSCQPSAVQYSTNTRTASRYITVGTRFLPHTGTKTSCMAMCMTRQLPSWTQYLKSSTRQQPYSTSTHYARATTEPFPWQRGIRKYATKVQKAAVTKSAKITPSLTISKPPKKRLLPTEKLRPKPKWVKSGISRTKVKSAGRKARRAAKKVKKGSPVGTEQRRNHDRKGILASIDSFDMAAYETAVLEGGPWRNLLEKVTYRMQTRVKEAKSKGNAKTSRESDKVNTSIDLVATKDNPGETKQKKVKQVEIPQDYIAPGTGSRISVRGGGKIERMLGKGRNVLGTSPVILVVPFETARTFGTLAKLSMDGRRDELPWKSNVFETRTGKSKECSEQTRGDSDSARIIKVYSRTSGDKMHQVLGTSPKVSYHRPLIERLSSTSTERVSATSQSTIKSVSPLLTRILSSPHMSHWYKKKPDFWLGLLKEWYFPNYVKHRSPVVTYSGIATLGGRVKKSLAQSVFSSEYPPPIPHKEHIIHGASALDINTLLEEARKYNIHILVELAKRQDYSAIRWMVRRILHPQVPDIRKLENGGIGDVLGYFLGETKEKLKMNLHETEVITVSQAGDTGLGHLVSDGDAEGELSKIELEQITLARQGLGLLIFSVGCMLIQAEPSTLTVDSRTSFFSHTHSFRNDSSILSRAQDTKKGDYTLLLPISKEILAYLHNCSLIPLSLYSPTLSPRLSILKSRVLTALADAVWRHQELASSQEILSNTESEQIQAPSISGLGYKLQGYWRGGFETLKNDYPRWRAFWKGEAPDETLPHSARRKEEVWRLQEMASRGEREVLLELVLRACILAGYGHVGSLLLKELVSQGGWSWISYSATWPEEYRMEDLAFREGSESTDGLPGQWGVRGYSVASPPIRTILRTLPEELIPDMAVAIVDSKAEGKGIFGVISSLRRLGKLFGGDITRLSNIIPRVISLWENEDDETVADGRSGELLLKFIRSWSPGSVAPGDLFSELQIWYKVLDNYASVQNIEGVERIWGKMEDRLPVLMPQNFAPFSCESSMPEFQSELKERQETHYFHPPWVLAKLLTAFNEHRRIGTGLTLLSPQDSSPFPVIPKHYYHLPVLTPALLVLATISKNMSLLNDVLSSLPFRQPGGVPHATLTSVLNAYLRIGDFASSQEVINYIKSKRFQLDGIDVAVLVENTHKLDRVEGYRFVEQTVKAGLQDDPLNHIPPTLRVRSEWGHWSLPFQAAAGKASHNFTTSEGHMISTQSIKDPPPAKLSASGWISVLNNAIEEGDRDRAEWALKALGIDLRKQYPLSTKIFNILLKGVVMQNGAKQGWDMITQNCVPDEKTGKPKLFTSTDYVRPGKWVRTFENEREWKWVHYGKDKQGVRANIITFRTVLDGAVREREKLAQENKIEWQRFHEHNGWEEKEADGKPVKTTSVERRDWREKMYQRQEKARDIDGVVRLCRSRLQLL